MKYRKLGSTDITVSEIGFGAWAVGGFARLGELITGWGKIDETGKRAVVYCDATIALPLIAHGLCERVKSKRQGPDMSWIFSSVS